jgi:23S rRNA (guanosine2251-2'-O)-methyltransferase
MESSKSCTLFFECRNSRCGLRFPLDTGLYDGRYCPRCGAPLDRREAGILAQKPPASSSTKFRIIGALDNIRSAHNVGAIFRTADGAGLSELLLGGITPTPDEQPAIGKTALGAEKNVKWSYRPNLPEALAELKANNCLILALEFAPGACSLQELHLDDSFPGQVVLVVGNEPAGVDPAILRIADHVLYIPMSGEKTSLNVSVAFGVAVYQLLWM